MQLDQLEQQTYRKAWPRRPGAVTSSHWSMPRGSTYVTTSSHCKFEARWMACSHIHKFKTDQYLAGQLHIQ